MGFPGGIDHRRNLRIQEYDYSQPGAYFLTLCTWKARPLFGKISNGKLEPSLVGRIVEEEWKRTANVRNNIELGAFVIMPDHLHGIIVIKDIDINVVGATRRVAPTSEKVNNENNRVAPTPRKVVYRSNSPQSGSIGAIVGQFKSIVTKRVKKVLPDLGTQIWQRNYYEHIILNENEWEKINAYIENNTIRYYGKY